MQTNLELTPEFIHVGHQTGQYYRPEGQGHYEPRYEEGHGNYSQPVLTRDVTTMDEDTTLSSLTKAILADMKVMVGLFPMEGNILPTGRDMADMEHQEAIDTAVSVDRSTPSVVINAPGTYEGHNKYRGELNHSGYHGRGHGERGSSHNSSGHGGYERGHGQYGGDYQGGQ